MGRSEMQVRTFQKSRGSKSLPGLVLIFCFHLKQPHWVELFCLFNIV